MRQLKIELGDHDCIVDRLRGWGWRGWVFALTIALLIGLAALLAPLYILICFVVMFFLPVLRYGSGIVMLGPSIAFLASVYHNEWSWAGASLLVLMVSSIVAGLAEYIGYKTG